MSRHYVPLVRYPWSGVGVGDLRPANQTLMDSEASGFLLVFEDAEKARQEFPGAEILALGSGDKEA